MVEHTSRTVIIQTEVIIEIYQMSFNFYLVIIFEYDN